VFEIKDEAKVIVSLGMQEEGKAVGSDALRDF
jgi:hypothetical protein